MVASISRVSNFSYVVLSLLEVGCIVLEVQYNVVCKVSTRMLTVRCEFIWNSGVKMLVHIYHRTL